MKKTPQDKTDAKGLRPEFSEDEILKFQLLKMKKNPGNAPWYRAHVNRLKQVTHFPVPCFKGPFDGYSIDMATEYGTATTLPYEHNGEIGRYEGGTWKVLISAADLAKRRAELAGQAHQDAPGAHQDAPGAHQDAAPADARPTRTRRTRTAPGAGQAAPADPVPVPVQVTQTADQAPARTRRRPAVRLDPAARLHQDARPAPGQAAPAEPGRHLWRLRHDPAYADAWRQDRPGDQAPPEPTRPAPARPHQAAPPDPAPEPTRQDAAPVNQDAAPAVIWRAPLLSIPEHLRHV